MSRAKTNWPSRFAKQLIPINQLITIPEGILIPFDHLEIADLSGLRRGVTLVTYIGPSIKVLITKRTVLHIKMVYKISEDAPLVQKYGVLAVLRAMSYSTQLVPANQEQTKRSPSMTSASWKLPDEATREFELPAKMNGAEALASIRRCDEFIVRTTETMLVQETKAQEQSAQS